MVPERGSVAGVGHRVDGLEKAIDEHQLSYRGGGFLITLFDVNESGEIDEESVAQRQDFRAERPERSIGLRIGPDLLKTLAPRHLLEEKRRFETAARGLVNRNAMQAQQVDGSLHRITQTTPGFVGKGRGLHRQTPFSGRVMHESIRVHGRLQITIGPLELRAVDPEGLWQRHQLEVVPL